MTTENQINILKKAVIDFEEYKEQAELFVNTVTDKAVILRTVIFNMLNDAGMTRDFLVFTYGEFIQIAVTKSSESIYFGEVSYTRNDAENILNSIVAYFKTNGYTA